MAIATSLVGAFHVALEHRKTNAALALGADGVLTFDDGGTGRSVFCHEDDRWRITHIRWSSDAVR